MINQTLTRKINKIAQKISFLLLFFLGNPLQVLAQAPTDLGPVTPIDSNISVSPNADINIVTNKLESVLSMVVGFLTILAGLYFLVYFIIGGLGWSTAGGDSKKVEDAKSKMTNGAIGLIIVVAAYSIVFIVSVVLGLDILNPGTVIINQLKPTQ